jgi:GxxExxY protein
MNADIAHINRITETVIGCAFRVMNTLGAGFLERVYENSLALDLRDVGLTVAQQVGMAVTYRDVVVGAYTVDLLVEDTVLVELKAVKAFDSIHAAQCINYLKATGLPLCLLLNFGSPRLGIQRFANS